MSDSHADLVALAEVLSDPAVLVDRESRRIVRANVAASRCLGFGVGELTGRLFDELTASGTADSLEAARAEPGREHTLQRKNGSKVPLALTALPLAPGTLMIVGRNVEPARRSTADLLHGERMSALRTLSLGVAHEVEDPLTCAAAGIDLVTRYLRATLAAEDAGDAGPPADVDLLEALARASDGVQRVATVVRNLLTFSQGNVETRSLVDVRGVLESAVQLALHEIEPRARLTKRLREVPAVEANETRLGQVFLNLLLNAAQAIPEGAPEQHEVGVETFVDDGGMVAVAVSDTGVGIDPELRARVFEPFFTTKSAAGLGLSLSHAAVREIDGRIDLEDLPGPGTRFVVHLPPLVEVRPRSGEATASAVPRVLAVHHDPAMREAIALILRPEHDVTRVAKGRDAMALLRAGERFDLVVCDLMMPGMSGADLYEEILRAAPEMAERVLFFTGGPVTARARAFALAFSDRCLAKPLDIGELRRLVRARLRKPSPPIPS